MLKNFTDKIKKNNGKYENWTLICDFDGLFVFGSFDVSVERGEEIFD